MTVAALGIVREDEQRDVGVSVERRASAVDDPTFWVRVTAVLLTLSLAVFGFIASMLISINSNIQAGALVNERQTERLRVAEKDLEKTEERIKELEMDRKNRDQREADYRFAIGKLLTEINTTLKLKGEIP